MLTLLILLSEGGSLPTVVASSSKIFVYKMRAMCIPVTTVCDNVLLSRYAISIDMKTWVFEF